ncbi:MAG: DEAD/DEAH box helicase [Opitutales bacterium]|nr:DEAD/DEAH box helicase [Opitutales bacterium]
MNILNIHNEITTGYKSYIESFIDISDEDIRKEVERHLQQGTLWPEPLIQFNPAYERALSIDALVEEGSLCPEMKSVFHNFELYTHQVEAIRLGVKPSSFVVTSGTGSGKSLTYIGSVFNDLFTQGSGNGIKAVLVYPMNALINSQVEELSKFKENYEKHLGKEFPIKFAAFTGQTKQKLRQTIKDSPPDILLTNYMMLELLLTRFEERQIRDSITENLKFLVFDELHTYRGRQGADVAMLIRRIKSRVGRPITCIGTSATMVSRGSSQDRNRIVAEFATKIFGEKFTPEQIVSEKLERSLNATGNTPDASTLARNLRSEPPIFASEDDLKQYSTAIWLENVIALQQNNDDGQLERAKPLPRSEIVKKLLSAANLGEEDRELVENHLNKLFLSINDLNQRLIQKGQRYTLLPFRLHQFFAQTGSVYATLDAPGNRHITLQPGLHWAESGEPDRFLFPHVFSRASGMTYICVYFDEDNQKFIPREFNDSMPDDDDLTAGYIIPGGSEIWNPETDLEALPSSWTRTDRTGKLIFDSKYKDRAPQRIHYNPEGFCVEEQHNGQAGWFMPSEPKGLLFDPTAGVFFEANTSERTKLTTLGSEGRSTSTTITSFLVLDSLNRNGFKPRDQKLLSFTDNRQDAALQAGHFNDFIRVTFIRSAIAKALKNHPQGLDYTKIGPAIFEALNLPLKSFAKNVSGDLPHFILNELKEAFSNYLTYQAIYDLRRGWRVILPNLEKCALLQIEYRHLDETVRWQEAWKEIPVLSDLEEQDRSRFLYNLLDYFRLEYAIHNDAFLKNSTLQESEKTFGDKLRDEWMFAKLADNLTPAILRRKRLGARSAGKSSSLALTSAIGKYIRQFFADKDPDFQINRDSYELIMDQLLDLLERAGFVVKQEKRDPDGQPTFVYQLRLDRIIWKPGDGQTVRRDEVKVRSYKPFQERPNFFFKRIYETDFGKIKTLRGEDHTGQLNNDLRIDREERFRADFFKEDKNGHRSPDEERIWSDSISALYCSPTMELGVDISDLSVVHMRNAPPNAANYAQRSGRAGRSGQAALVMTYCSSYSPHDRNFFNNKEHLVAGVVEEPRIDLLNRELIESHVHSLALTEIGLPGVRESVTELLDPDLPDLPLRPAIRERLTLTPSTALVFRKSVLSALETILPELENQSWFTESWVDRVIQNLPGNLDHSLERWRHSYREAKKTLDKASSEIANGVYPLNSEEYKTAKRLQDQATRQRDLLKNDIQGNNELTEFYVFRYLASEGFLPGYNFTRLPVRTFVSAKDEMGEYISRPRLIALREFGPLNIIYHNGNKYRIEQVILPEVESHLDKIRVCAKSGFCLDETYETTDSCPFTGIDLSKTENCQNFVDLLQIPESRAEKKEYITCEEEERRRLGFSIETFFTVKPEEMARVRRSQIKTGQQVLLNLAYIPAAQLIQVNRRDRTRRDDGFPLGMKTGFWKTQVSSEAKEDIRKVMLWAANTADALYMEPLTALALGTDGVLTLMYALKRGIERVYQIEPSELAVSKMGTNNEPNIFLYEASEGSLGILSQLVDDVEAFKQVIREAQTVCRFDDPDYQEKASYDDLLSYYNQPYHLQIDRFTIKGALEKILTCSIERRDTQSDQSYREHYERLLRQMDSNSSTEKVFLDYLFKRKLRLPDFAQKEVNNLYIQPDFHYAPDTWVFCDGTPHDQPEIQEDDRNKRDALRSRGDEVIVYHYKDSLDELVTQYPDIFTKAVDE